MEGERGITTVPSGAALRKRMNDSTRAATGFNRLPVRSPTMASPVYCCHQLSVSLSYMTAFALRSRPVSDFASMKASMSGWSQRSVAIMSPWRLPADMMVRHMASHTSMKLSGPEASAPMEATLAP